MVFPAMQYGENIHVEGCISSQLLFNLNQYVIPMLMAFLPACKWINITAAESMPSILIARVGSGFQVELIHSVHF